MAACSLQVGRSCEKHSGNEKIHTHTNRVRSHASIQILDLEHEKESCVVYMGEGALCMRVSSADSSASARAQAQHTGDRSNRKLGVIPVQTWGNEGRENKDGAIPMENSTVKC